MDSPASARLSGPGANVPAFASVIAGCPSPAGSQNAKSTRAVTSARAVNDLVAWPQSSVSADTSQDRSAPSAPRGTASNAYAPSASVVVWSPHSPMTVAPEIGSPVTPFVTDPWSAEVGV